MLANKKAPKANYNFSIYKGKNPNNEIIKYNRVRKNSE